MSMLTKENFSSSISTGINFSQFSNIPVTVTGSDPPPKSSTIHDAGLHPLIVDNVVQAGYTTLTPVQQHSLPIILAQRDLMAAAQTGSGKTAAFLLPILHRLLVDTGPAAAATGSRTPHSPLCLVVTPTRELALQIHAESSRFSHKTWLRSALAYGGMSAESLHHTAAMSGPANEKSSR